MLTRQQKEKLVEELADKFSKIKSAVFADFKGLKVSQIQELRQELRQENVEYQVAKKTLIKLALKKADLEDAPISSFTGPVSIAFGYEDETASARLLNKFARENKSLVILGGFLDKNYLDKERVLDLARLPSKSELLARVINSLQAPIARLVNLGQGNLRKLVYILNGIANK